MSLTTLKKTIERVQVSPLTIKLPISGNKPDVKEVILDGIESYRNDKKFLYPLDIKILGSGMILDENDSEAFFPNVVWVSRNHFW